MPSSEISNRLNSFLFYCTPAKDSIPLLSKIRLIVIYSIALINIVIVIPYAVFFYPGDSILVILFFRLAIILFCLAPVVFWITRNLQLTQWIVAVGVLILAFEEILDLNSFPGIGPLVIFAIIPIFYLVFDVRIGVVVPAFMAIGTVLRILLSDFSADSLFLDKDYAYSFMSLILIAGLLSIVTVLCISLLYRHLNKLAFLDQVTGLPNRNKLHEGIEARCSGIGHFDDHFSLIGVEILNFNNLNSNIGTKNCDTVLREVASRLESMSTDQTGRWSGSIFMSMGIFNTFEVIEAVCKRLLARLNEVYQIDTGQVFVQFVLAVSRYPEDGVTVETLTENVISLLDQKSRVPGDILFYNEENLKLEQYKFRLNDALNKASLDDEFFLEYQPKMSVADGRCSSAEALLRWSNGELGSISPSVFIPLAEEAGLIRRLTRWVIIRAFTDRVRFRYESNSLQDEFTFAINLSILDLKDSSFISFLVKQLEVTGCLPNQIEFEVTEGIQADKDPQIMMNLELLRNMGFKIAIDDFGTGYSSLSYLHKMDAHNLKIDKSFIDQIQGVSENSSYPVVDAIISMGKSMGIEVTAEGVERSEQLNYLKRKNCDIAQGWFFAKSMKLKELVLFVESLAS